MKASTIVPIGVGAWVAGIAAYKGIRSLNGPRGHIGLIGDSYAQGLGMAVTAHQPPLPGNANLNFEAHGVVGSNIAQWAELAGPMLQEHPFDWVVLSCCLNDAKFDGEKVKTAMRKFVDAVRGATRSGGGHIGLAWVRPPQTAIDTVGGNAPGLAKRWRALVGEGRTLYVPDTTILAGTTMAPDGLHPLSYKPWCECLWHWLAGLTA